MNSKRAFTSMLATAVAVLAAASSAVIAVPAANAGSPEKSFAVISGPMVACKWTYDGKLSTFTVKASGHCGPNTFKTTQTYPAGQRESQVGSVGGSTVRLTFRVNVTQTTKAKVSGSFAGKKITGGRYVINPGGQGCWYSGSGAVPCESRLSFTYDGAAYKCSMIKQVRYEGATQVNEFVGGTFTKNGRALAVKSKLYALCAGTLLGRTLATWTHYSIS